MSDLHLVNMQPLTAEEYIEGLQDHGGNLMSFTAFFCPDEENMRQRWLYQVLRNFTPKQLEQWRAILQRSQEVRLDYLQAKCMQHLEAGEKLSTADIAYAKAILDELFTYRAESVKKAVAFPWAEKMAKLRSSLKPALWAESDKDEEKEAEADPVNDLLSEEAS